MRASIMPGTVTAWTTGRWGPRRVLTNECYAALTAETAYDRLVHDAISVMRVGARGDLLWRVGERTFEVSWELRQNSIWKFGRAFLICRICGRLATRIYLLTIEASAPACRRCLGMSYASRQLNYRDVGVLKEFGVTSRLLAYRETELRRTASRRAARDRRARRRQLMVSGGIEPSRERPASRLPRCPRPI